MATGAGPILCCPDSAGAVQSLAALFGVAPDRFARALSDAALIVEAGAKADVARAIVPALTAVLDGPPVTPSRIHFFHGTRAFDPALFLQRGLLPLREILDDLWQRMQRLAPEVRSEDFTALRKGLEDGRVKALTYKHRIDTHDDGPHGVLVRDVLLDPESYSASEFLRIPEIVEDICVAAHSEFEVDLQPRFERATTPCVVEFATQPQKALQAISAACWYAESALRSQTARGDDAFWNFCGEGVAVPPGDIVLVDVVVGPCC